MEIGDLVRVIAPEEVDGSLLHEEKVGWMFNVTDVYVCDGVERAVVETIHREGGESWRTISFNMALSCLEGVDGGGFKGHIIDDKIIVRAQVTEVNGKTIVNIIEKLPDLGAHLPVLKWHERLCKCAFCGVRFPRYRILDPNKFPDNAVGDKATWKVCASCRVYISGTMFVDMSKALDSEDGVV